MLLSEFYDLTGYLPTQDEYTNEIEPEYYGFEGDKYHFCYDWLKRTTQEYERVLPMLVDSVKPGSVFYKKHVSPAIDKYYEYCGKLEKILAKVEDVEY